MEYGYISPNAYLSGHTSKIFETIKNNFQLKVSFYPTHVIIKKHLNSIRCNFREFKIQIMRQKWNVRRQVPILVEECELPVRNRVFSHLFGF